MKNRHNRRALGGTGAVAVAMVAIALAAVAGLAVALMSPQGTSLPQTGNSISMVTTTSGTNSTVSGSLAYLTTYGGCAVGGSVAPCWGGNASTLVQFSCLTAAKSPQGCNRQVNVTSPSGGYSITVWNPMTNSTAPTWSNCYWSVQPEATQHGWGYCSQENSTSFILGIQGPGKQ
jgi:hypothetical protein